MIPNSRPATEEDIKVGQDWLDKHYPGCYLTVDEERNCYTVRPIDLFLKHSEERKKKYLDERSRSSIG